MIKYCIYHFIALGLYKPNKIYNKNVKIGRLNGVGNLLDILIIYSKPSTNYWQRFITSTNGIN